MDVERTIEFLLDLSARNTVEISQLKEAAQASAEEAKAHAEEVKAQLRGHEVQLRDHEEDLHAHTEWKSAMSQIMQQMATQMKDGFDLVAKKQAELADNLNILIRTVQEIIPRLPRELDSN